jgi:wyosine [tRNA(Phe)-imidazoG37] synthetase (radical SAM superfamily)
MNDIAFGPVPSRRLGRSIGINNIPPKICTYSCVYCQVGRTTDLTVRRRRFYEPEELYRAVEERVEEVRAAGDRVDYLTFVPDGEPTLDVNLGRHIQRVKELGIPVAVITNASLIWDEGVRRDLMHADWVSLKLDAVAQSVWRRVNRPHHSLSLSEIMDGALTVAEDYSGKLVSETMLVAGINDGEAAVTEVAEFLERLRPAVAYLAVPTRPPAESWVQAPDELVVNRAYQLLRERGRAAEYLTGYEGNAFTERGSLEENLLSITAVHPMREDAVRGLVERTGRDWETVEQLVADGKLVEAPYGAHTYYVRKLKRHRVG